MNSTHESILLRDEERFEQTLYDEVRSVFSRGDSIVVKLHMGEPGNTTHLTPQLAARVVAVLRDAGCAARLFDTPVVYTSPRSTGEGYLEAALKGGFVADAIGAPVTVSDRSVVLEGRHMTYRAAADPIEADGVLLLTHFKGHICTGVGGAIKNVGMGCMSRSTKGAIHAGGEPVYRSGCTSCNACVENCPTENVRLEDGRPFFDATWCPGCSNCVLSCPERCIAPKTALFDTLLAEAAVLARARYRKLYAVNVMKAMTRLCDCVADAGPVVAPDIGYILSREMVAADAASLDVLERETGSPDLFASFNRKPSRLHVREAARMSGMVERSAVREAG